MTKKLNKNKVSYEDCVGVVSEDMPATLFDKQEEEWKTQWVGMPEYEQNNNPSYKTIYVHFRNKEDFDEFSKKYLSQIDSEQHITVKTKSLWYPHLDRDANSLKRWIESD